jgi:methylase of polypeptide subunit release factors
LDLGFGSGVFGIYFAKFKNSRVVGVDINRAAMYCASANATRNNVSDQCEFFHGDLYAPVYNAFQLSRQFDIVIANLPFSRAKYVNAALRTAKPVKGRGDQYREMFTATTHLLEQVLFGAIFFLKPGGQLLLLTGGSADLGSLRAAARLSGLQLSRTGGNIFQGKSEQLMVVALQKSKAAA